MSYGVIKRAEAPDEYRLAALYRPVDDADFTKLGVDEGTFAHQIVTKGFQVPEQAYPRVVAAFAKFLKTMEDASFVSANLIATTVAEKTDLADHDEPCFLPAHVESTRCSTLSVPNLKNTIRPAFEEFVRETAVFLPPAQMGNLFEDLWASSSIVSSELSPEECLSTTTTGSDYNAVLKDEDFLTPAVRSTLDKIENGMADVVNNKLMALAVALLVRAELSLPSTARDARELRRHKSLEGVSYSTLNPEDLLRMVRTLLQGILPGLVFSLPAQTRRSVFDRLNAVQG